MAAEVMQLRELVLNAKLRFHGNGRDANWVTVDSPVPYSLGDLITQLDKAIGRLDNRGNLPTYLRLKAKLSALQTDRRYAFMFDLGVAVRDNLAALLGRLFRVPANGKPLAILDLVSIPSEALNVVVAVVCRLAFDFAVLSGRRRPCYSFARKRTGMPPGTPRAVSRRPSGALAHRQGRSEIRHQPRCDQSAALRTRLGYFVAMQHRLRLPYVQ